MYAVMWSEHCSYKSSAHPPPAAAHRGRGVLVGPGENAGVIDVGDGIAAAIRIESHNHPSLIEPYQGAATGVGGILRDIFTMGARPIAVDGPAALRPARRRPQPLGRRRGRVRHLAATATRSACPPSAARSCSTPATRATRWSTCCASGCCPIERLVLGQASGVGNLAVLLGSAHRARRHRRRSACWPRPGSTEGDEDKRPSGAGRRPVRGEAADRGLPGAARRRPRRRHPGPRRRRPHRAPPSETASRGGVGHGRRRLRGAAPRGRAWSRSR